MSLLVSIAVLAFVVVLVCGSIVLTMRTLATWRAFRSLRRSLGDLDDMVQRAADVEERLATASETAVRLDEATARLRSSVAYARVVGAAASEARAAMLRVRATVPRK